jgi:RimJ/RimL family protein N-acetyltransferase
MNRRYLTPRLETPRLILRPFASSDWDAVNTMLSDPVATRYMHFASWTEDQRRDWFDWCVTNARQPDADALIWAIFRRDPGDVIGWLGIGTSSDFAVPGERSFGYLLDRAVWNRGYMTEALRAVLAYEFGIRRAPRLRATCNVANAASARVMEKVGMRREKTVFDANFEGNWAERHHYSITKTEYEARG